MVSGQWKLSILVVFSNQPEIILIPLLTLRGPSLTQMVPPDDPFRPQSRSLFTSRRMTPLELRDHLPKWHDYLSDETVAETAGEIPSGVRCGYGLDSGVLNRRPAAQRMLNGDSGLHL